MDTTKTIDTAQCRGYIITQALACFVWRRTRNLWQPARRLPAAGQQDSRQRLVSTATIECSLETTGMSVFLDCGCTHSGQYESTLSQRQRTPHLRKQRIAIILSKTACRLMKITGSFWSPHNTTILLSTAVAAHAQLQFT